MSLFPEFRSINSNNGLPSDQVHAIAQDSQGRLWFCGPTGLARFNGRNFQLFNNQNILKCQGLRTVEIFDDIVWIGTDQGFELINSDGTETNYTYEDEWFYGLVQSFANAGSTIWAGSALGLIKIDIIGNALTVKLIAKVGFVRKVIVLDDNSIYATSANGIIKCKDDEWDYLDNEDISKASNVFSLARSSDNMLLVGTEAGLFVVDSLGKTINHILPDISNVINSVSIFGNELWLGLGDELIHCSYSHEDIKIINSHTFSSNITCIFIDSVNNVWIGTNTSGIKKISCLRFAMTKVDTGAEGAIYSIRKSNNKTFRIGGETFFSTITNMESKVYAESVLLSSMPKMTIWDSYPDPVDKSNLWIASQEGIFIAKGDDIKRFDSKLEILKSPARCFASRGKDLYIGTISGLLKINNFNVEVINCRDGINLGYIYQIAIDSYDKLWIATLGRGLFKETSDGLTQISNDYLLKQANTYSVVPHSSGKILVLQDNRVIIIDKNGETNLVLNENPVAGWSASWLDENRILIGSNNGLLLIDTISNSIISRINPLLGKSGWQFTNSRALYIDSEENIICGLNAGLYSLNLRKMISLTTPPEVSIDSIVWENASPVVKDGSFNINSGKWTVKLSVFSVWFFDEELVRYRYKLVGFDNDWSELTESTEVKYNSLPPGKYELKAQAFTSLTGYGPIKNIIKLNVTLPAWGNVLSTILENIYYIRDFFVTSKKRNDFLFGRNIELENEILNRKKTEVILKSYNEELQKAIKKAEESDKLKSSFLANMSHEIRTPLNSIIGFSELLNDSSFSAKQKNEFTEKIIENGDSLLNIIEDILDLSMLETMQLKINKEPFALNKLLQELELNFKDKANKKGIKFEIMNGEENHSIVLNTDYIRLKQVFSKLINNAIKFTYKGNITIGCKVKDTEIEFYVKDTGIGIPSYLIPLIFEKFRQVDDESSRFAEGNGLGLSISKNIVLLLDGKIWVESKKGVGSTFYITIPCKDYVTD